MLHILLNVHGNRFNRATWYHVMSEGGACTRMIVLSHFGIITILKHYMSVITITMFEKLILLIRYQNNVKQLR